MSIPSADECPGNMMGCDNGTKCFENWRLCDGHPDCKDGSDESMELYCASEWYLYGIVSVQYVVYVQYICIICTYHTVFIWKKEVSKMLVCTYHTAAIWEKEVTDMFVIVSRT